MRYKVIKANTHIRVGKKVYKSGDEFNAKESEVKSLLENKIIKEVSDGKTNS